MYKRRSIYSDRLTGNSGDVNPQFLTMQVVCPANDSDNWDALTTQQTAIPIQRLPSRNSAQVMEILKIYYNFYGMSDGCLEAAATENNLLILLTTDQLDGTLTGGTLDRTSGDIIDMHFVSTLTKDPPGTLTLSIVGSVEIEGVSCPLDAELSLTPSEINSLRYFCCFYTCH